ncbi:MAG: urea transport system ATP-binding protein [Chthoniobacter sp.]|jgi:urea transport system ATP-binding protein|nr:urea transport system ATP-binding protein [Chthoniobacter sp.]
MLSIQNLQVSIGGSRILRGVTLEVPTNRLVCLMGRNGVGKTTTLKSITGLQSTSAGEIVFDGKSMIGRKPDARARAGIAYVPQGRDIFPHLTVWENLKIGLVAGSRKVNGQVTRVLDLFPILKEFLERKGGVLSGGQQQQLAIARALLTEPKLLILDEPTEGIQPNIIDLIGDTLQKLKAEGSMSILLVEQYLDFAQQLADDFYIMDRGTVVAHGDISGLTSEVVKQHLTV